MGNTLRKRELGRLEKIKSGKREQEAGKQQRNKQSLENAGQDERTPT